jgi:pyruvate dehydrogenase E2 component (dihydrolipoamide acetyltransferase)
VLFCSKAVGDEISEGDVIAAIETDKAAMDLDAVEDGFLGKCQNIQWRFWN